MQIDIKYIYSGTEEYYDDGKKKKYKTSYRKNLVPDNKNIIVTPMGFTGDNQSDKDNHGGVDKAVCVYSQQDYNYLKDTYSFKLSNCAFGENLTILGVNDSDICLGDQFSCGEVIFEVSQPRQPCWKISSINGKKDLTSLVVKEYRTGFYFRVIKSGVMSKNSLLVLTSRVYPALTIEHINKCAFNSKDNQKNILEIINNDKLAEAYKISLSKRYKEKSQGLQDWQKDEYIPQ